MITQLASIITINTAEPNTVRKRTKNPASKIGREQPPHENASQLPVPREANYATATLNQDTSLSVVKDKTSRPRGCVRIVCATHLEQDLDALERRDGGLGDSPGDASGEELPHGERQPGAAGLCGLPGPRVHAAPPARFLPSCRARAAGGEREAEATRVEVEEERRETAGRKAQGGRESEGHDATRGPRVSGSGVGPRGRGGGKRKEVRRSAVAVAE